jgi:hypothetical protein
MYLLWMATLKVYLTLQEVESKGPFFVLFSTYDMANPVQSVPAGPIRISRQHPST